MITTQKLIQVSEQHIVHVKTLVILMQMATQQREEKIHQLTQCSIEELTLASPNTMYVSDAGFLYTSGLLITNSIFFDLRMVTLLTPCTCKKETQTL
jgi:hypothetical protein